MTTALERFNALARREAEAALLACCGSSEWARRMAAARPFQDEKDLAEASDRIGRGLSRADWLEAFAAHPKIGSSVDAGPALSRGWSREEQQGTDGASSEALAGLAAANRDYEARFGHVFIVCASGRTADEMLAIARRRLANDPEAELAVAAEEQRKITRLRLEKLLATVAGEATESRRMSGGITTHVLDTSRGRPAEGVPVRLDVRMGDGWRSLGSSQTDRDGRARDLFAGDPPAGTYRLTFGTAAYFTACGVHGFYPLVEVVFEVRDPSEHHHVPLLLSPFGYSTYRGS